MLATALHLSRKEYQVYVNVLLVAIAVAGAILIAMT